MTRASAATHSWVAIEPTPPAAPWIRTSWPRCGATWSRTSWSAVNPGDGSLDRHRLRPDEVRRDHRVLGVRAVCEAVHLLVRDDLRHVFADGHHLTGEVLAERERQRAPREPHHALAQLPVDRVDPCGI